MKTKFTWIGIITILILGISIFFVGCKDDELNSVVQYHGQVVYINTTNPFPDLTVKVTDGKNTHCLTQTDADGMFKLLVHVEEIDGNYYLQAGDSTCIPKKVNLGGYGQDEVDLGVIEVEGPALPTVKTKPITEVTAESATLGGIVETDGRLAVTARGICYSTEQHPTVDNTHTTDGSGLGEFTSNLTKLNHNTVYYARAYATNRMGTAYGEQVKFTTELGVPVVITDSVYRVTVNSARCKGHVESDGGYSVTQRGTCWSKFPDPTLDDDFTSDGSGIGEFTSALNNLQENTTYYVRSYATNSMSTVYGEQKKITTLDGLATVITTNSTTTATSMVINCEVTDDSGYTVTERGICYSAINSEPSIDDSKKANGKGKGTYSVSVSELTASTIYYVRAYAINEYGVAYSSTLYVTTLDGVASISILSIDNVTALTASGNIKVTNTNGGILKSCGLCWSTNSAPTVADSKTEAGGSLLNTTYQCNMSGLTPNTTYYVRGFATTDITTAYSEPKIFRTHDGLPIVTTTTTTATSTNISSGGTISSNGGYSITARGVCYSTNNSTPTIIDNYTTAGVGTGIFSSVITSVSVNTTYYVRAYATNSIGTGYGEVVSVTTGNGLPTITTTNITKNGKTFLSGGNVTDDGGSTVLERGICYGTFPHPDLSTTYSHTSDGTGTGYYTSTIGSSVRGIVYVRAYATNANGTSYGNEVSVDLDYLSLPTFIYNEKIYRVAPNAPNTMLWGDANTYCYGLYLYGYSDWRLPDRDELHQMYALRASIGGFVTTSTYTAIAGCSKCYSYPYRYWSGTSSGGCHYFVGFDSGAEGCTIANELYYNVRPIREEK